MAESPPSRDELFQDAVAAHGHQFSRIANIYAHDEAEDLVQEMLLQIWRGLPGFRAECQLGSWCYRVALNTALAWRRKSLTERHKKPGQLEHDPATSATPPSNEQSLLRQFLTTLSEVDQAVLLMYLANLSSADSAAALGVTEGAVRTRLSRVREKLSQWGDQHA